MTIRKESMENSSVITIQNLVKRFPVGGDYFTALKDVNLTLSTGEFTGLIGPSGSGKTTLLNIIGGLDSSSEGQVSVLGKALDHTSHAERAVLCLRRRSPKARNTGRSARFFVV